VEVLPYIGEEQLYKQYRKDEPWDSEHNMQILVQMPDFFRSTGMPSDATETRYLAPVGLGTAFDPAKPIRIRDISDGTSNTLMIVQSPQESVPWTKPVDLPVNLAVSQGGGDEFGFGGFGSDYAGAGVASGSFLLDAATQQLNLGGLEKAGFLAVFCDGTVAALKSGIARAVLRQLLCRADGNSINAADYLDKSELDRISRLRGDAATAAEASN
jgi:hypothetical protein